MTTVYEVPPGEVIAHVADELKEGDDVTPPGWAAYVKTGPDRERPPEDPDWWYTRVASVLRKVYIHGPIGTERLRSMYGGPVDHGSAPDKAAKGSGSIVRTALQQLEAAGLAELVEGEGRKVTPEGRSFLDNASHEVAQDLEAE